jgi:hypothetical protein
MRQRVVIKACFIRLAHPQRVAKVSKITAQEDSEAPLPASIAYIPFRLAHCQRPDSAELRPVTLHRCITRRFRSSSYSDHSVPLLATAEVSLDFVHGF